MSSSKGSPEIKSSQNSYLRDLAFTLSEKRSRLAWNLCLNASSISDLCSSLEDGEIPKVPVRSSSEPRVGFIFTGQGAQWARMGIELNQYPIFRQSVEKSDQYLRSALACPWSATEEMGLDQSKSNINLPEYCQPICTVLQVALVDLLESWNICPSVVAGHSSGEIAAAYCLGALNKEDALKIAYHRGLLSSSLKKVDPPLQGAMIAVGASESDVERWISQISQGEIVVACVNSPSSVTVSGDTNGITELQGILAKEGVFARRLEVDTAYHSPHMEMLSAPYLEAIQDCIPREATESRKMFSSVTGCLVDPTELGPMNWVRNLTSPVLFYDAFHDLMRPYQNEIRSTENAVDFLVELGPHSALKGPMEQTMRKHNIKDVEYRSVLLRGKDAAQTALATAGELFLHGVKVDISQVNRYAEDTFDRAPQPIVDLPSYAWDHSRQFWSESRISKQYRYREHPQMSLLGSPCPSFGESEKLWRGFWSVSDEPWIRDHVVQGSILYPAAGYIAMAIEAAGQAASKDRPIRCFRLRDVQIHAPSVLTEDSEIESILQLRPHLIRTRDNTSSWFEFTVSSCTSGQELRQSCHGLLLIDYETADDTPMKLEQDFEDTACIDSYDDIEKLCCVSEDPKSFYDELAALGMSYGPTLRTISQAALGHGMSCCTVDIPTSESLKLPKKAERAHVIHPATLDGIFHLVFAAHKDDKGHLNEALVPKSIDEMTVSARIPAGNSARLKGVCTADKHGGREVMAEVTMLDEGLGSPVVSMKGFCWATLTARSSAEDQEDGPVTRKLFSKLEWKPAGQPLETKISASHFTILEGSYPGPLSQNLANSLVSFLESQSCTTTRMKWGTNLSDLEGSNCISLMEVEKSFLRDMTPDDYDGLKDILLKTSHLLWVTALDDPTNDMVLGLARVLRNEIPGLDLRILQLQSSASGSPSQPAHIIGELATSSTYDSEFSVKEGELKISRVTEDEVLNADMSVWMHEISDDVISPSTISQNQPQKLATKGLGMLDALCLEKDDDKSRELGVDEVEIEVRATGVK